VERVRGGSARDEILADGREDGAEHGDVGRLACRHDQQAPLLRRIPRAGDGRLRVGAARGTDVVGQPAGVPGRRRAHVHDKVPGDPPLERRASPAQDGVDGLAVRQHHEDDAGPGEHVVHVRDDDRAVLRQRRALLRRAVPDDQGRARAREVARHGEAHEPGADEADAPRVAAHAPTSSAGDPTSFWSTATPAETASTTAEPANPLDSVPVRSDRAPDRIGPSIWPAENATVNSAIPAAHARSSRARRRTSVMTDTTARKLPPNRTAETATPAGPAWTSGAAAPAARAARRNASERPGPSPANTRGHTKPDVNVLVPSRIQKALMPQPPQDRSFRKAITNVM